MRRFLLLLPLLIAACDDMTDQPKETPYSDAKGNPETPPPGTVMIDEPDAAAPPVTAALLDRGRQRYDIYCSACHGLTGAGDGMIVARGFPTPPSFHGDALRQAPPQRIYDAISHGYGVMYSFAGRIPPADRWAIAAYVKALQASREAKLADVPAEARRTLE